MERRIETIREDKARDLRLMVIGGQKGIDEAQSSNGGTSLR